MAANITGVSGEVLTGGPVFVLVAGVSGEVLSNVSVTPMTYTLTGPTTAASGMYSTFTVTPAVAFTGQVVVSATGPSEVTPLALTWADSAAPQTAQLTFDAPGTYTVTVTGAATWPVPAAVTVAAARAPFESTQDGPWATPATWGAAAARPPGVGDVVVVHTTVTVAAPAAVGPAAGGAPVVTIDSKGVLVLAAALNVDGAVSNAGKVTMAGGALAPTGASPSVDISAAGGGGGGGGGWFVIRK